MNGSWHKFFGLLIGVGLYQYWNPYLIIIPIAIIGSTLPDIDLILPFFKHRGITHSILGVLFVTIWFKIMLIQIGIVQELEIAFVAGYLSHLVLDSCTPQGVKWLYPLSKGTKNR